METKTVTKGDKFIWNNAIKVEVIRSFKTNKFCTIKCSSLLTSWTKKQPLPLPETFVPVDSFDAFDDGEEYWGEPHLEVSQFSDIEAAENMLLAAFGKPIATKEELREELDMTEEEFDQAMARGTLVEVTGGRDESESGGSPDDDRSTTAEHLHGQEVRREEDSGLPGHDPDAT